MATEGNDEEIKEFIKKRYGKIVKNSNSDLVPTKCSGCCGSISNCTIEVGIDILEQAKRIGYSEEDLKSIPDPAVLGLGCGNPTALTSLKEDEIVLDLGAGAGIDVFLAANKVGDNGRVIGVDMTSEMVAKGQENAEKFGYSNVEFKLGEIENLPIEDNSIDVIISNCVVNLAPDKSKVYREAYRVLKPGGRILISDIVTEGELPEDIRKNFKVWSECIAGAVEKQEYLEIIRNAGFENVEILSETRYFEKELDERLLGKITSVSISAQKPNKKY